MAAKKKSRWSRSRVINIALGLALSAGCIAWLAQSVEPTEVFGHIKQVRPVYLLGATVATCLSYIFRSVRWPYFFKFSPPSLWDSFRCVLLGFFMNIVLPARIGEFVRAHLGGRATNQSRTYVLATIAGERLIDGLTISLIFVVLFTGWATGEQYERGHYIFYAAYFFGFAGLATIAVLVVRARIFSLLERVSLRFRVGGRVSYAVERARRFIVGLEPMLRPRRLLVIVGWSLVIWFMELGAYYLVGLAFNTPLNIGESSLFLAAVNFSSLLPAAPGGVGVIEAVSTTALQQLGIEREVAFVMVSVQHLIQIAVVSLPAVLLLLFRVGGGVNINEVEDESEAEDKIVEELSDFDPPNNLSQLKENRVTDNTDTVSSQPRATCDVSVVIPAFNEQNRISVTLNSFAEFFSRRGNSFEMVVVDDGSLDRTAEVVTQLVKSVPQIRLLGYSDNRGKGFAVRYGMQRSIGRLVLYSDADGAAPIAEFERLERAINEGADVAIGSRALFSHDTAVKTVWYRKVMGRVFNNIANLVLIPGIADTQCGFKLFSKRAAELVFSRQTAERFSFDVEILYIARRCGLRIVEIPINWTNVPGSKVNLVSDSLNMLIDIFRFRVHSWRGMYR